MPRARVTAGSHAWYEGTGPDRQRHEAAQGQEVDVSADELKRGQELGSLEPADAKPTEAAAEGLPKDLTGLSDKELKKLAADRGFDVSKLSGRDELLAAVAAAPGGFESPSV